MGIVIMRTNNSFKFIPIEQMNFLIYEEYILGQRSHHQMMFHFNIFFQFTFVTNSTSITNNCMVLLCRQNTRITINTINASMLGLDPIWIVDKDQYFITHSLSLVIESINTFYATTNFLLQVC